MENIDIDKDNLNNIDIDMAILENIAIDIDKGILQNIDIDKISYQLGFGISNTPSDRRVSLQQHLEDHGTFEDPESLGCTQAISSQTETER